MATFELTSDNFFETITGNNIVFVDFWVSWCGPCRAFSPIFEAAAADHPDMVFAKVNTEIQSALASAAKITSIPTLMAFREGVLVHSKPGALSAPALAQVIQQVADLDMSEVHATVAEQKQSRQET